MKYINIINKNDFCSEHEKLEKIECLWKRSIDLNVKCKKREKNKGDEGDHFGKLLFWEELDVIAVMVDTNSAGTFTYKQNLKMKQINSQSF